MNVLVVGVNAHTIVRPAEGDAWKNLFDERFGPYVELTHDRWGARILPGPAAEHAPYYAQRFGVTPWPQTSPTQVLEEAAAEEDVAGVLVFTDERDPACDGRLSLDGWSLTTKVACDEVVEGPGVRPGRVRLKATLYEATRA